MSVRETVYDPSGTMFEVKASLVPDLLLQKGWTRNKPETVEMLEDESVPKAESDGEVSEQVEVNTPTTSRRSRKGSRGTEPEFSDGDT